MDTWILAALYKFVSLPDYEELQQPLKDFCDTHNICGSLLLASEGINGTVAGSRENLDALLAYLKQDPRLATLEHKESISEFKPFFRMKVKLKKEIVTMGVQGIDPNHTVGTYVDPKEWNDLISQDDVILVDTRNDYEYRIGTFENAIDPETKSFREFPQWIDENLDPKKHKKVAMFCTGGIRCEKSTALMKEKGFEEVYHLKGGILKYLEEVPQDQSKWQGDCFVFDHRVAVDHNLEPSEHSLCFGCMGPITPEDIQHPDYEEGVCCPHCVNERTEEQKAAARERKLQIQLAKKRGTAHIGPKEEVYPTKS